ncbi:sensor histidine kinase [Flavihumibacter sp. UBA7668]|uniref:sensor histidine kinase n=1 Tax=Flavihumibacter sp. UBA7668 TaxID=1946542 RepID=UPI0025C37D5E|nr:histidine kinase [Flavihumibacter sp. UBA7668]
MQNKKYGSVVRHATFWGIWIGTTLLVAYYMSGDVDLISATVNFLPSIGWFYFGCFLLWKGVFGNKKIRYIRLVFMLALFPVFHIIRFSLIVIFYGYDETISFIFNRRDLGLSLTYYIQYNIFALGYSYFVYSLERQKRIQELELNNRKLEIQQLHTEFNFLKAQINPHFLYNTLNTLFAHAQYYSEELANNILKLSEIMRYSIEGLDKDNGMVNLKNEIHYLHNLIDIHQLRFSNELQIDFTVTGPVGDHKIPPLVFITFVENALKYGELKNRNHPLIIRLDASPEKIYFYCQNRKKKKVIEKSSGIGIQNVLRRLDVSFKGKYDVVTTNEEEFYTLELTLYV